MEMLSTSDTDLEKAAAAIAAGFLVAFPTETVYGLGADAFNRSALARIFEAKGRPRFDPLIIHIAALETLWRIADESLLDKITAERLSILTKRLWPGPLTLILPKRKEVPDLATSALAAVAIRFPSHPVAQKLIRLSTGAVAAPSANLFGCLSPTRASHVKAQLGDKIDYIVDGGKTQVGVESTVLDLSRGVPRILRQGGTEREKIVALIGPVEISCGTPYDAPLSPGQLKSHYAPNTPLVLCKRGGMDIIPFAPGEGRLYFSHPEGGVIIAERVKVLSETGNAIEAAANLFDYLHELDSLGLEFIRAEEAPDCGLGEAINDRLRRAAH
jgi:L-threonylcarbamoyladenylate synthase